MMRKKYSIHIMIWADTKDRPSKNSLTLILSQMEEGSWGGSLGPEPLEAD